MAQWTVGVAGDALVAAAEAATSKDDEGAAAGEGGKSNVTGVMNTAVVVAQAPAPAPAAGTLARTAALDEAKDGSAGEGWMARGAVNGRLASAPSCAADLRAHAKTETPLKCSRTQ